MGKMIISRVLSPRYVSINGILSFVFMLKLSPFSPADVLPGGVLGLLMRLGAELEKRCVRASAPEERSRGSSLSVPLLWLSLIT